MLNNYKLYIFVSGVKFSFKEIFPHFKFPANLLKISLLPKEKLVYFFKILHINFYVVLQCRDCKSGVFIIKICRLLLNKLI